MILADDEAGRRAALAKILPMQRGDFAALFEIMTGLPVTIRLLDPPLHEFLPHTAEEIAEVARGDGRGRRKSSSAAPRNCTSSTRCSASAACRLAVAFPEIAEMQARAIFEGAVEAQKKTGEHVDAGNHGPAGLYQARTRSGQGAHRRHGRGGGQGNRRDHSLSRRHDDRAAARGVARRRDRRDGRILLLRHQRPDPDHARHFARRRRLASSAPMSRRASSPQDPFVSLDQEGVGELVALAAERGRADAAEKIKLGICGEHGGDPGLDRFLREGRARLRLLLAARAFRRSSKRQRPSTAAGPRRPSTGSSSPS